MVSKSKEYKNKIKILQKECMRDNNSLFLLNKKLEVWLQKTEETSKRENINLVTELYLYKFLSINPPIKLYIKLYKKSANLDHMCKFFGSFTLGVTNI